MHIKVGGKGGVTITFFSAYGYWELDKVCIKNYFRWLIFEAQHMLFLIQLALACLKNLVKFNQGKVKLRRNTFLSPHLMQSVVSVILCWSVGVYVASCLTYYSVVFCTPCDSPVVFITLWYLFWVFVTPIILSCFVCIWRKSAYMEANIGVA